MERLARSLNLPGIERFRAYLASLRAGATAPPPFELLDDPAYSDELPIDVAVEQREFADRLSAAWYLFKRLSVLDTDITDRDEGLWAWLSLQLFDQVCPARGDGQRRPGRDYRHIPEFDFRNRHRHLLLGPYQIYRRHGARSMLLLAGPVDSESGLYHEIVSRQDLIANRGVLEAAVMLYLDPKRDRPKPGAQGSHRQPGTVRRFVRVLQQLDVNYDIYGLSGEQILELLPAEFDVWRPQRGIAFAEDAEPVTEWAAAGGA
jgi:hypothetical protein